MRIEIPKEGRMDMSGQGLIRAIQNNNMPLLDLLVRESIQNSLDAYEKKSEYVQVNFGVKAFDNDRLADELEGISSTLKEKYAGKDCRYIYIKDSGTEGLTGPVHFSQAGGADKKNLLSLVYEIAKPQEKKGAGGSWGYGKTTYFRIGIGLVIYYSHIKLESGLYQSRLAACLIEDEKKKDALLNAPELNSHRGLAWWGKEFTFDNGNGEETGTIPEMDENVIRRFLEIFDFEPFGDTETGTAILIPYIDEKRLLTNNISMEDVVIPWISSISEYIKIAVQRWYPGRLNNENYLKKIKRPWLRVTVDGEGLGEDKMALPFKEIRKLYNMALNGDIATMNGYHCEPVKLRNYFKKTIAGHIAYKMFTPEEMGMNPPYNNPSPFIFVKNEDGTDDYKDGDIILTYFRKPGMAVTYDTAGEWVNRIKCYNERTGDVLIAVFVLNSDNRFNHPGINELDTIEEYFRSSEHADHTAWFDITVNDVTPKLLSKIQQGVRKKINETYKKVDIVKEEKSSSLSKMFGDIFLPPQGFGKRASKPQKKKPDGNDTVRHKNAKLTVMKKNISINDSIMTLPISICIDKPIDGEAFLLEVAADGKNIPISQWKEKTGLEAPFCIEAVDIKSVQSNNQILVENLKLSSENSRCSDNSVSIAICKSAAGENYGMEITTGYKNLMIDAEVKILLRDVTAQLVYQLKEGELA